MNREEIKEVKWLFQFLKPYRIQWVLGYLLDIIGTGIFQICNGVALERLGDGLLRMDKTSVAGGLKTILFGAIVITITGILFWLLYGVSIASLRRNLKNHIFHKVLKKEYGVAEDFSGEIITYLNQDVEQSVAILGDELRPLIYGFGTSVIAITAIFWSNTWIGLICLLTFVANIFVTVHYKDRLEKKVGSRQRAMGHLIEKYKTFFDGGIVLRSGNTYGRPLGWVKEAAAEINSVKKGENRIVLTQNLFIQLFLNLNHVLPMTLGVYLCMTGAMEIGKVFFLVQMSIQFIFDYQLMGPALINISKALENVSRLYRLSEEKEEAAQYGNAGLILEYDTALELKNLTVEYDGKRILSVDGLRIPQNKMIAVVGESGSGKSTFLKTILQAAPWQGQMTVFGVDAKEYELKELRKAFSYVEQTPHLFNMSIWENILVGNSDASREEVLRAAHQAGVDEFVDRLADRYHTVIGENGTQLSGGECQRIAIARALLKNAPIFVMDEVTSALDSHSENIIQKAVEDLRRNHTIIIAAHRLNTIENADYILSVENGNIIE